MAVSNSNQRKIGVILQYAQMALSAIIALVYTPIMLRMLGQNEYGIFNVASSTISYLSLLSLGLGVSYIRFYSLFKKNNEQNKIKGLNGIYLITFFLIGLIALIAGLFLTANVTIFYNETYSMQDLEIAKILQLKILK